MIYINYKKNLINNKQKEKNLLKLELNDILIIQLNRTVDSLRIVEVGK